MKGDDAKVVELCKQIPEGPLHTSSIHKDTILHMATYYGKSELALNLLEMLPDSESDKLTMENDTGNTMLHEAANSDKIVPVAMEMLRKAPKLLGMRNKYGETALFVAARYGQMKMFKFLDKQGEEGERKTFYQKKDQTTILHAAIIHGHFGVRTEDTSETEEERDTSWEVTEPAIDTSKPQIHYDRVPSTFHVQAAGEEKKTRASETALLLATKKGILEIAEKILTVYPQAVEHIDDQGHNILHKAIMFRQIGILNLVDKLQIPTTRLVRKIDNKGNTILHMVGIKEDNYDEKDMRSPALLLRENLLLFERVKKISVPHLTKYLNNDRKTAEELLETKYTKLWKEAKEWLKRTAENCSIVSVLIATVAFAAAYTVPGDVLSLAFALASVMTFLSILTSSFQFKDFKQSLPRRLMLGVTLLIISVTMMMVAFAATVFLLIRDKEQWTRIAVCSVAFFPVSIFVLSYLPLYKELVKVSMQPLKKIQEKVFMQPLKKIQEVFPRFGRNQSPMLSNTNQTLASSSKRPATPQTTQGLV
ncbi:hypothetical protein Acr_15g0018730 [Actinidia rufa]|uniref:PGG domain-containing protein n=1 Tax=Actinidia rufa TaxID=165716 RepID=A0A7J0FX45_9ERIC|nr:hypothetical protein Acr_15g0018730 [Actinidia rufa]